MGRAGKGKAGLRLEDEYAGWVKAGRQGRGGRRGCEGGFGSRFCTEWTLELTPWLNPPMRRSAQELPQTLCALTGTPKHQHNELVLLGLPQNISVQAGRGALKAPQQPSPRAANGEEALPHMIMSSCKHAWDCLARTR